MEKSKNHYVVWVGRETGVFDNWEYCKKQVTGFSGASYKSYQSKEEAERAFSEYRLIVTAVPDMDSISADGSCLKDKTIEYRVVDNKTKEIIDSARFPEGTNNIAEILSLVSAIRYVQDNNLKKVIYTDSMNAITWLRDKTIRTSLEETDFNAELFGYIRSAINWMQTNEVTADIRKWNTKKWGQIPADYGRK